jgi:signal transduction histidine kinase
METLRILVVDDEPGIRMAIARALRGHVLELRDLGVEFGFEVSEAGSGEDGLDAVHRNPPDILLLDYKLPGISGLDVLDRLRSEGSDVLTVIITAYASLDTAVSATKRGAFDFLAKPFNPDELKSVIFKASKHLVVNRQALKLAAERKRVRFEFLSIVAHELKAPTAAIEGYLLMLRDRALGEDVTAYEHPIDRAILRLGGMRKLIADLLDLTRIESGEKRRELRDVDVREIARLAVESGMELGQGRGIDVVLEDGGQVRMQADPGELELILNNLVSNAVKYNRDNGTVRVGVGSIDGEVTLRVTDTGIGMRPEDVARLFGEFVRIKNDKTRRIEGSGLGLSIVRKLADLYEGRVRVESEVDVGSTFTVTLGRSEADRAMTERLGQK